MFRGFSNTDLAIYCIERPLYFGGRRSGGLRSSGGPEPSQSQVHITWRAPRERSSSAVVRKLSIDAFEGNEITTVLK